jgi:hypothetical protein
MIPTWVGDLVRCGDLMATMGITELLLIRATESYTVTNKLNIQSSIDYIQSSIDYTN